jgi:hypothetical protein
MDNTFDDIFDDNKKMYKIEGEVDFFAELYKSLDQDDVEENNMCLITNKPLVDKYVELTCSHKFNYVPLYKDIYNHKKKFNFMEANNGTLKNNEIRCPYCRQKQVGLLPYYENMGVKKTAGVNFLDETVTIYNSPFVGKCEYVTKTSYTKEIIDDLSNKQVIQCYSETICHSTYVSKLDCNNKTYCYSHKKQMIKDIANENKQKAKDEAKLEKQKAKDEAKLEKQKAKDEAKLEKQNKQNTKKSQTQTQVIAQEENDENYIVSNSSLTCVEILKTGINKGKQCCETTYNEQLCKRHYNLKNNAKNKIITQII